LKSKGLRQIRRRETIIESLFVLPQFIIYTGLTIIPFFIALPLAFVDKLDFLDTTAGFVGLRNFIDIFKYPIAEDFFPALGRTLVFVVTNYTMVYCYGLTMALIMYEFGYQKIRHWFFIVIFLPYMLSRLGVGMLLIMLFSRDSGSYNLLLMNLGILSQPFDIKDPSVTAVALPLIVGWRMAGFYMAIFLVGLMSISQDTVDAAKVDGVTYLQRLRHIYIPQIVPSIALVTVHNVIRSFGIFDVPIGLGALYGNINARYLGVVIYTYGFGGGVADGFGGGGGTLSHAVAMSLVVYLPLILGAMYLTRIQKKLQY
jgi:ABC-type sugar transport system permease subunit